MAGELIKKEHNQCTMMGFMEMMLGSHFLDHSVASGHTWADKSKKYNLSKNAEVIQVTVAMVNGCGSPSAPLTGLWWP